MEISGSASGYNLFLLVYYVCSIYNIDIGNHAVWYIINTIYIMLTQTQMNRRGCDRMVVGLTTTYAVRERNL